MADPVATPSLFDILLRREAQKPAPNVDLPKGEPDSNFLDKGVQFLLGLSPIPLGDDNSHANRGGQLVGAGLSTAAKLLGLKTALMPLASPIRDEDERGKMLLRLAARASQVSPQAEEAVTAMGKKYPRLMAHVGDVKPADQPMFGPVVAGGFTPSNELDGRGGVMTLSPGITRTADVQGSIAHELQHAADTVKIADRLRQRGLTDAPGEVFSDMYRSAGDYGSNPFETRARAAEEAQLIPRQQPGQSATRQQQAVDKARDLNHYDARVAAKFNLWDYVSEALQRQALHPNTVPAPPPFSDLLADLNPSKFGR